MSDAIAAAWTEVFDGGSPEAERAGFRALVAAMLEIQEKNRGTASAEHAMRTLHAKILVGIRNAKLHVDADLPEPFWVEYFMPGAIIDAVVRFSNASGIPRSDALPDMRGIAIKLHPTSGVQHDLLMTNYPVSHARNAHQFVEFATIAMGDSSTLKERLEARFGVEEATRMRQTLSQGMRPSNGLQYEMFWNRGAMLWGDRPVRLILRPEQNKASIDPVPATFDGLREAFAARLRQRSVAYRLALQPFISEVATPIEDAAVEWCESASKPIEVATLVIPQQDILEEQGLADMRMVNGLAFNPWNAPAAFRPLGNINRARGDVYGSSARQWTIQN